MNRKIANRKKQAMLKRYEIRKENERKLKGKSDD
jgi:hypothetical protein